MMGILQGLSPIIGRFFGAGDFSAIGRHLRAGAWLALALSIPMMLVFAFPDAALELAQVPAGVRPLTRNYLHALAFGVPALMLARVFYAFAPAAGHPRAVMTMNVVAMTLKLPLSYALVNGAWGLPELGGPMIPPSPLPAEGSSCEPATNTSYASTARSWASGIARP